MALDVREGDILVVHGREYPIRACAEWKWRHTTRSLRRMLTESCSTMRAPGVVDGKRGAPAVHLTALPCMPLDPVDAEISRRMGLETPHELLQTILDGGDVFYSIVLEQLKR